VGFVWTLVATVCGSVATLRAVVAAVFGSVATVLTLVAAVFGSVATVLTLVATIWTLVATIWTLVAIGFCPRGFTPWSRALKAFHGRVSRPEAPFFP